MELFAGVDIGSTTSKCVLLDEKGEMLTFQVVMTEFDRNVSGSKAFAAALEAAGVREEDVKYVVSTGYGRKAYERADMNIPEIIAHGMGTYYVDPTARTIIDIGGQDSKV
ncbi:MAG: BadF/BadG/BcrA/BcrD ATPase family protein, partial [Oscillospiraceae bacterium]|nr:BadF/BadG/BcrA/BcrD ATPase family protein [Oscillospiraceae bacterium]